MNRSGTCKYAAAAVLTAALVGAAVWGSGWLWSRRDTTVPVSGTVRLLPERVAVPGRAVAAELTLRLPLYRSIRSVVAEPGKDTVLSGPIETTSSWRWSHRIWRVVATLRPLRTGKSAPGRLTVEFHPAAGTEPLVLEIPPLQVEETDKTKPGADSPLLAGIETPPRNGGSWFHLLWLIVPAALLGWWAYRRTRRRMEAELPPWVRARAALAGIRAEAAAGRLAPAAGVEKLTDVVRSYLEERFGLPAPRLTTPEFIVEVAGAPELPAAERAFLRDFMAAADLVKFARAPAAPAALDAAVGNAELLVEHTIPREEEKTGTEAQA